VTARYASANNGAPPHSQRGHPHVGPAVTGDGDTNASYGFRRQFLVTAEAVLRTLLGDSVDPGAVAVLIEPTCSDLGGTDGVDDDIVDFAIEAPTEARVLSTHNIEGSPVRSIPPDRAVRCESSTRTDRDSAEGVAVLVRNRFPFEVHSFAGECFPEPARNVDDFAGIPRDFFVPEVATVRPAAAGGVWGINHPPAVLAEPKPHGPNSAHSRQRINAVPCSSNDFSNFGDQGFRRRVPVVLAVDPHGRRRRDIRCGGQHR
jgi:hypothetical protein